MRPRRRWSTGGAAERRRSKRKTPAARKPGAASPAMPRAVPPAARALPLATTAADHGGNDDAWTSSFFGEFVAHAVDRQDVPRPARIRLEFSTDVLDVRINGALVRFKCDPVDLVEELPAGKDSPRLPRQRHEELEFCGGQRHRAAPDADVHPRHVEG